MNRVSLGARLSGPARLAALERNHAPEEVERAVELVRGRFPAGRSISFSAFRARPWRIARRISRRPLALGPSHLSCYGLVYEKGTNLWKQWQAGQVVLVDEETERAMYETVIDRLAMSGLSMYEISNYARPGHESRHNLVYWANDAYFGVGLGARELCRWRPLGEHSRPGGLPPEDRGG